MKRILTGNRTTGKLHLGHYVGTLENRVKLQDHYETFIMQADVQALTDNFDDPAKIRQGVYEDALDNLAAGVDPNKATLFIQSQVPEIAELTVYFLNLVTLARLERNPTVKAEMQQKGYGSNVPVGFLSYPISEAADILTFRADLVPAGEDQQPMIEQTREIARKFNSSYGQTFELPELKVGRIPKLVGTDGNAKMSKSLGNVIFLSDSATIVETKVMNMYTDPNRLRATDPGRVEENPLFTYLDAFCSREQTDQVAQYKLRYTTGTVGDIEIKQFLASTLNSFLEPIRQRRGEYEAQPHQVLAILKAGTEQARSEAVKTMLAVRKAMKINYF